MQILTDGNNNKKLNKIAHADEKILAWSLPPIKTCPCADKCKAGCYGLAGRLMSPSVRTHADYCLELSKSDKFVAIIDGELAKWSFVKKLIVRLHVTGDFYSQEYAIKWAVIAKHNPSVTFYAYTKSVSIIKSIADLIPSNLHIVYSYGGTEDVLIDKANDRHVIVLGPNEKAPRGYWDITDSDRYVYDRDYDHHKKLCIRYHGSKKYENTEWAKVIRPF